MLNLPFKQQNSILNQEYEQNKSQEFNSTNIYSQKSTKTSYFNTNNSLDFKNNENEIIFHPQTNNSCISSIENKNKNVLIFQCHYIGKKRIKNKSKKKLIKKQKRKKGERSNELDNIRNNIKNKLFDFIIDFFNEIINKMGLFTHGQKFLSINSEYKKQITKNTINKKMQLLMKDILKFNILERYVKKDKYKLSHNNDLYYDIKNQIDEEYKYLFNMPLYEFYNKFFLIEDINGLNKKFGYNNEKYPLKNVIKQINKKEKYKIRYEKTAKELLSFANINIIKNKEINSESIKISENDDNNDNQSIDDNSSAIYDISSNSEQNFKMIYNKQMKS